MAVDKSKWNKNIKVSQKTIDEIKKMGMSKALKTVAGASAASKQDASAKEWAEGVKRLYTAERVNKAIAGAKPKSSPATSGPKSATTKATYKTSGPKSANTKAVYKSKGMSTGDKVKAAGATALAIGALAASRGRATGVAARLAPGLTKSPVGRALFGTGTKTMGKVPSSTLAKAKANVPGSVKVGAKGSFGKTTSGLAKGKSKIGTKSEFANKATEDAVRAALAKRAANAGGTFRVGPKKSFGKTTKRAGAALPSTQVGKKGKKK